MTEAEAPGASSARPRFLRRACLLLLAAGATVAVIAFVRLSFELRESRAAAAALKSRVELDECGSAAVEALRGDLETALDVWKDDEAGRAWLSRCAFPVGATPAGGTTLPGNGRATILLLARPGAFFDAAKGMQYPIPTVRIVAWYTAESTETPSLVSWESEPLVSAEWLGMQGADSRREAVETLAREHFQFAWSLDSGPRPLDLLTGDVARAEGDRIVLRGIAKRWCGEAPGSPVLARGLGHPAFHATVLAANSWEIRLTLELKPGPQEAIRREFVTVARGL